MRDLNAAAYRDAMSLPPGSFLTGAAVETSVFELRPDYRAMLIVAEGLTGGPTDEASDAALTQAEAAVTGLLAGQPPESLPQIASWRAALGDLGIKPRVARSSVEALVRRAEAGLPRINRLTDLYNAVSVEYLLPLGGEDLDGYVGPPRLARAEGTEIFETVSNGEPTIEHPEPGEVVWRDDAGVTCRRWNWRQCVRTRLTESTTRALFILDALDAVDDERLAAAAEALAEGLRRMSPDVTITSRLISAGEEQP